MEELPLGIQLHSALADEGVVPRKAGVVFSASDSPHGVVHARVAPVRFDEVFSTIQACSKRLALAHNTVSTAPVFPLHSLEEGQIATRFLELTHNNLAGVLYARLKGLPSSGGLVPRRQNTQQGSVYVFSRSDNSAFPEDFEEHAVTHLETRVSQIGV